MKARHREFCFGSREKGSEHYIFGMRRYSVINPKRYMFCKYCQREIHVNKDGTMREYRFARMDK